MSEAHCEDQISSRCEEKFHEFVELEFYYCGFSFLTSRGLNKLHRE